ncbi:MAG TPA: MerR family transcriptional regulator [Terriglobales bacterium]|nr:MerR family transcriptional regulator [Terriglobales bacterium]
MPAPAHIPDKLYFRIGEVARMAGVEPYVLRFWETEFPALKPGKSSTGQRLYRRREVELALEIKRLLHEQGFTIAGARQQLKERKKNPRQPELGFSAAAPAPLAKMRRELEEILGLLNKR